MKTDRSQNIRGAHVDEILATGNIKKRLDALETAQDTSTNPTTTLTGVPQCATPFLISSRVDADGLVYPTLRFTSIAQLLRRFWPTIRKVKRDGTYGKERRHPGYKVSTAEIGANSVEMEWFEGLPPNFTWDCVLIEAKLTDDQSNDGGSHDQTPNPYISKPAPDGTQLGRFVTGPGQPGNQVFNFCQNSKFKFGSASWLDLNGTDDNGPTTPGPLTDNDCAKWRYALDQNRGLSTVVANGNYWRKVPAFPATMNLQSNDPTFDPCSRMQGSPFDPGEPFNVAFSAILNGTFSGADLLANLTCSLIDDGLPAGSQVVASTTFSALPSSLSRTTWNAVQMPPATCLESWVPVGRQWVRWHLDRTFAGRSIIVDKVMYSQMQGAYSRNANDLAQTNNPQALPTGGGSRGASGYGSQSGNFQTGGSGGIYRPSTD